MVGALTQALSVKRIKSTEAPQSRSTLGSLQEVFRAVFEGDFDLFLFKPESPIRGLGKKGKKNILIYIKLYK